MRKMTRRTLLDRAARFAGALGIGLPLLALNADGKAALADRKLKVVVAGGHPDDPESGCGGTIARYSDLSHRVGVLYLTRGEAGIEGKSAQEAAAIRTAECRKACDINSTQTESRKRAACYAHASQNPVNGFYATYHEMMNRFRGLECGCELAEGFVRHCQSPTAVVPGL